MTGSPPASQPAGRIVAFGLLLPAVAGAACVFGFAPFHAWPVPIVALAALFAVWAHSGSKLQAALTGFAFGLGYFLAGVSWVYVSMHDYGSMPAVLAAFATFAFCAYLSIFPAIAGALIVRFAREPAARIVLAPAAFVALEWIRGWLFTGFPWLSLGTSQIPGSPLAGFAPYVGAYGTSLAVAGAAAIITALFESRAWSRARFALIAGLVALFAIGGLARLPSWTDPAGAPVSVALLQGNISQHIKWRDDVRGATFDLYREMIVAAPARVVVIPETALPAFFDQLPVDYVRGLREHARVAGKSILLGTVEREARGPGVEYYNGVVSINGEKVGVYRKRHLVPFGEFIPMGFHWVLDILKIPLTDFGRGPAMQPPLQAAGITFGVSICYEDIFGEEVIESLPAAQVLVNVTNDAWFGESFAPDQHLQASQMRALETGRWMVRATNTGVTAAIDPSGRVVKRLPWFTTGTLLTEVVPMSGLTPYARWGNYPALMLMAALAALAIVPIRRRN